MDAELFLNNLSSSKPSMNDRAIALLWFLTDFSGNESVTSSEICKITEECGFGKQNVTRTRELLKRDRRVIRQGKNGYRIHPNRIDEIRLKYQKIIGTKPVPVSDSVVPRELFSAARGYIVKVVVQINAAYEFSLFDCCAVMCRRLLETLIIESYEVAGFENKLKNADGNFMMFSGILAQIEKENILGLSRNCIKGLKDFKKLGDLSAHNRKFNAIQDDIDRIRDGVRIASEELLHLSNQSA